MSMFQSLYSAADSIRINQSAISVINNNIANMNTEGYSKQRIDLKQGEAMPGSLYEKVTFPVGGVEVDTITRYTDIFLEGYYRQEKSSLGYYDQMTTSLNFVEEYFNELDGSGITGAMNDFFTSAQEMAMDPTNRITRSNFINNAQIVTQEFNSTYNQLTGYRESLVGNGTTASLEGSQISSVINEVNNKLSQIADLNDRIATFSNQNGVQPNTLLDARQKVLSELSEFIPISVTYDGVTAEVALGKVKLIERGDVNGEFSATPVAPIPPSQLSNQPAVISFGNSSFTLINDFSAEITEESGQLKALLDLGGDGPNSIYNLVDELNLLAQEFARTINDIQVRQETAAGVITNASMCMNGLTKQLEIATEYIFIDDASTTSATLNPNDITAQNIQMNKAVINNPFLIANAYVAIDPTMPQTPPVAVDPAGVGNNNNALAFADSRSTSLAALGGFNVEDHMASMISTVGNLTSTMNNAFDTQAASVDHVNEKRQSISGVNLDEELMDLVKYQNSYNASARVFSVIDEMVQMMMNLLK